MSYLKTLKQAEQLLEARQPFTTGTLSARYDMGGNYLVFSYDTMIAGITKAGLIETTKTKYSVTTSKHLNIIKRAWGVM
jgi:hypothetical protein